MHSLLSLPRRPTGVWIMEPGYGTDPEGDKQQPTSRSAGKPPSSKSASAASHLPSPDIRAFPLPSDPSSFFLCVISHPFSLITASRPSLVSHAREEPQRSSSKRGPPDSRPSVLVRSFPAAQYPVMNPSYPSNGSPFPQPHPAYHHPASTPGQGNGVSSTPMAGQGHPSPYAYPVHHAPYPSHAPFPHYSPYPQQIMMYAPPRPNAAHEAVSQPSPTANHSSVSLGQLSTGKRKRKPTSEGQGGDAEGSEEIAGASGLVPNVMASGPRANAQHPLPSDSKKRTKTQRACDSCRSRKIRFVRFLFDSNQLRFTPSRVPMVPFDAVVSSDHCLCLLADPSLHQTDAIFSQILTPLYANTANSMGSIVLSSFLLRRLDLRRKSKRKRLPLSQRKHAWKTQSGSALLRPESPLALQMRGCMVWGRGFRPICLALTHDPLPGPTSEAHLLHSSAAIPSRLYENYDARHHHTWEILQNGDGLVQVLEPTAGDAAPALQKPVDMRIERDVVEKLVNAYFSEIAPVLPVITQAEFLSTPSPPPILLYSICLVAAARREVPQNVFDAIRYAVNAVIKAEDVLSTASIVNVQSLLILCMVGDCHSQFVPNALSAVWIRLGTAIRMVRGMGGMFLTEAMFTQLRRRLKIWVFIVQRR